ncbi:hypothetical protein [Deinococcus planocerae]|uniref:hypothetical protein n=1 Tax=Deinococcus planocerae TaxID=1737569 RepID=UPI000C7ED86E|nr:hypothetical protein [Deinococcus planocerae]
MEWIVHPLAGVALAFWGSVIFSRRGRQWRSVALAAGLIVLLAALGANWVVHPAAGMLLGFFGSRAFGNVHSPKWRRRWPGLVAGLVAAVFFMALGAGWLIFPLSVMAVIWLFTAMAAPRAPEPARLEAPGVAALPEQAGGLPMGHLSGHWTEHAEARADRRAARRQAKRARREQERREEAVPAAPPPPVPDPAPSLAAYVRDERLPGEARAQLAALDLRTKEALTHLEASGQGGSEAAYLARAVRDEYAPTAVQAYLKLPPTLANVEPLEQGKTGRDLLHEQLNLLLNGVQDILGTALHSGGRELLTHGRFLEDKFRKPRGDLDV